MYITNTSSPFLFDELTVQKLYKKNHPTSYISSTIKIIGVFVLISAIAYGLYQRYLRKKLIM